MLQSHVRLSSLVTRALLIASGLTLLAATPAVAQKVKPAPNLTVTVTMANRTGDAITSVGAAEYEGGVIFGTATGDLRLDLGTIGRALAVTLGDPITTATGLTAPSNTTFLTDAVLFIENLQGVPVNSTATRVGRLGLGSGYPNHALGFRQTTVGGVEIFGTPVCVSRPTAVTWSITSSSCSGDASDTAGFFEENLKGKVSVRFKANYSVPFAFTVTCTANCPQ